MCAATADGERTDHVPVYLVAYTEDAEIDYNTETGAVENHDELVAAGKTVDEIRMLKRSSLPAAMQDDIVEPGDRWWCDEVAELAPGEAVRLSELDP